MTSTRMHRIEAAARLAMADFMAGDAVATPQIPLSSFYRYAIMVLAIIAITIFGFSLA